MYALVMHKQLCVVYYTLCVHTKWLLPCSLPMRNSVQTGSLQTRANLQLLPR